jgi:Domain of unknown function (DUF4394)
MVASLVGAAPATAEPAAALLPGNSLLLFDTATPATTTALPVTGLGVGETLSGIDQRPNTLGLYGMTVSTGSANNSMVKIYALDPASGQATLVGGTASPLPGAADVPGGFDFNPIVDRMRYVNALHENARFNPNNGALAGDDTDLTPAAESTIIGEAYDRNVKDSEATTLYAIDAKDSALGVQGGINGSGPGGANGGTIKDLGPLGFTVKPFSDGGFDINRAGTAYAGLTSSADNLTRLYTIDLAGGTATAVGLLGSGLQQLRSLAILNPKPAGVPAPSLSTTPPSDNLKPTGLLAFKPGVRASAFRRSGISGGFSCSEACTVTAKLVLSGKKLATGSAKLDEAGVGTLKLRATKAGKGYLPGRRPAKATLTATFTDLGGGSSTLSRKVALSK